MMHGAMGTMMAGMGLICVLVIVVVVLVIVALFKYILRK